MGPLAGIRIIEMAGLGPAPFCAMMLADNGAQIIRIGRPGAGAAEAALPQDVLNRSRASLSVDLKTPGGVEIVKRLARSAHGLIEGFRPGVMERLGLGPDAVMAENPALVYGRVTGWGQTGPYSHTAGHDINYIALSGALAAIGRPGQNPTPPLNLVGDFGSGGMLLAFGMVSALLNAHRTGAGQVIDCAMTDGSAALMACIYSLRAQGEWQDQMASNMLDGAAPYYDSYKTSDGKYIALGAVEPQFYDRMLRLVGLHDEWAAVGQDDREAWPRLKAALRDRVGTKTRDEWCAIFEGTDACFAPVMSLDEAPGHPHNKARDAFLDLAGVVQPAPVPRYSVTPNAAPRLMAQDDAANDALLREAGFSVSDIAQLRQTGAISTNQGA